MAVTLPTMSSKLLCQSVRTSNGNGRAAVLEIAQLLRQLHNPGDVVIVDVADHQQPNLEHGTAARGRESP